MKYLYLITLASLLSFASFAIGPISGKDSVCMGSSIQLSDATVGGTWSSSNSTIASVGLVTGLVTGGPAPTYVTAVITYSAGGSSVTTTITVCPIPEPMFGLSSICPGNSITLTDVYSGGTWNSGNNTIATIDPLTGVAYGVAAGTDIMTYTLSPGCSGSASLTVTPLPTVYSLTGGSYCAGGSGASISLSGSQTGVNYQLYLGAAVVGGPVAGTGSSVSFGLFTTPAGPYEAVATYTVTGVAGCASTMSGSPSVVINPLPTPYTCSGGGVFCARAPGVWFSLDASSIGINYQLYSSSGPVGSPIAGDGLAIYFDSVIAAGTYSVLATNAVTACTNWMTDSVVVIINPALSPITGITTVCSGSTTQLSDATPGGVWSYSNSAIATIGSTNGLVTANIVSTVVQTTMTYSVSTGYGCVATTTVTVNPPPATIIAPSSVCSLPATFIISDATSGGTWSTSNSGLAFVSPATGSTPTVYTVGPAVSGATLIISYTIATGCVSTSSVTLGMASPITGPDSMCVGSTISLSDATPGGAWFSSNPTVATMGFVSGVVTGVTPGITIFTDTFTGGCVATLTLTVNPLPTVFAVTGGGSYLSGGSGVLIGLSGSQTGVNYQLYNGLTPVGLYVSGTGAAINFGLQTAVGTYSVIASNTTTTCSDVMGGTTITFCTPPSAITGPDSICISSSVTLSDAISGGIWSSGNTAIAAVNSSGLVTGLGVGTTNITYGIGSCSSATTVFVNTAPTPITGTMSVCDGLTTQLSDATGGGIWSVSTSSVSVATVTGTGLVVALSPGTGGTGAVVPITYTIGSCYSTASVTVNPLPSPILGTSFYVCPGTSTPLGDTTLPGSWSSSNTNIAWIDLATAIVTGVSTGNAIITYTLPTSCITIHTVTVVSAPAPISGSSNVCSGQTTQLSDFTGGGNWSSSNTGVATIDATTGIIAGVSSGTTSVTYSLSTGCSSITTFTVNPTPSPITGITTVCSGTTTQLSDATPGGVWSGNNYTIATVDPVIGIVYTIASGITTISYSLSIGCSATITVSISSPSVVTISASPGDTVCAGTSVLFSAAITGGTPISYVWDVNSVPVGSGSTYTFIPSSGNVIFCEVSNTSYCSGTTATTTSNSISMVVNPSPSITATASASCNGIYALVAGGGTTYSWSPATGLSCSTCATATVSPVTSVTYTVTGATGSCSDTASVFVDGNSINGVINYTGGLPTDTFKVWLINYNPTDSLILATDSTFSCMSGGTTPYYQFTNEPAGNYMVKAQLLSSVPGTSGYVPTYSLSSPNWSTAATAAHTITTDIMNINMIYGTVPFGPGFIAGNIYSGAGRGTSVGIPAAGMLIFLEDGSGNTLTYTYTDTNGAYIFDWIAYGNYIIYPEDYKYYTTPSAIITLSSAAPPPTGVDFKQHTTSGTITPYDSTTGIKPLNGNAALTIFPNPAKDNLIILWKNQTTGSADIIISDMVGREVFKTNLNINAASGQSQLNIAALNEGVYLITIKSGNICFNSKLLIQK